MMLRSARRGQATAEFAIAFSIFALLMFGVIEAGRAIYEKDALARAAETMVQTLAQADVRSGMPMQPTAAAVSAAIAQANQTADLNLSTAYPFTTLANPTGITGGNYDPVNRICVPSTTLPPPPSTWQSCEFATNLDGHVLIIGIPYLGMPDTLVVTISVPYHSFLGYPLQALGNQAQETVAATTLHGQVPLPGQQ